MSCTFYVNDPLNTHRNNGRIEKLFIQNMNQDERFIYFRILWDTAVHTCVCFFVHGMTLCLCAGLHPSKAKLELQKHLAGLDNQEQAAVFESTMVSSVIPNLKPL